MFNQAGSKRNFGMTPVQMIVLGFLGLFACGLLAGMGWLLIRSNQAAANSPTLASTAPLQATEVPIPADTATIAQTPTEASTPTITPIPRESLIPLGWVKLASGNVEIWLPPTYVGGDLLGNRAATIQTLNALGPYYGDAVAFAQNATADYLIYGVNTAASQYMVLADMSVSFEPQPVADLEGYVANVRAALPAEIVVMETRRFTPPWGTAGIRWTLQSGQGGDQAMHALYFILNGDTVWWLQYTSYINDFYTLLPTFEQSARTFWIAP
jgi:hypothetical protein